MKTRNVVITGVGLCTPLGNSLDELAGAFAAGRSAIRHVGGNGRIRVAACVEQDLSEGLSRNEASVFDRTSQLSVRAGDAAFRDAGLTLARMDGARGGVFLGCGSGPSHSSFETYQAICQNGTVKGLALLRCLANAPASHLSIRWQLRAACQTYAVACASAAMALGEAMRAIRHGYLDLALAGGVEAPLGEGVVRAWEALRVLARPDQDSPGATCRPFSADRNGIVLGEGAALFVLESEESALARGATIYARFAGYGCSADASHLTSPSVAGQTVAMRAALADAQLEPADIGYINAHGTATKAGDLAETRSVRQVFGSHADAVPMSSTKSMHGHLLGASGGIELAATVIALRKGLLPPTAHLEVPDPECDLDYVAKVARHGVKLRAAMSNSFAFGGSNSCLIIN
ncbi:beta-ketoacyl-[acyl-carrier-protein] synthase family protein [Oxalobacteraceae bacterium]|nr:beta-ketoacyl-[acyl-carrier-protein] synthase family protein [Oxalobacteraceae bacterium]